MSGSTCPKCGGPFGRKTYLHSDDVLAQRCIDCGYEKLTLPLDKHPRSLREHIEKEQP